MHVALTARYYGRTGHRHLDTRRVAGVVPGLTRVEVNRVPKGVVGIISPWNYPFTLALCDGLPALLAGNAVVHKPDAQTMLTALLGRAAARGGRLPEGPVAGRRGPGPPSSARRSSRRADYVCFTGSTATGKQIAKQCADRLIGCSLELGGKNPILVLRDADLDRAAEGAVRASFSNAGQLCVSTERMFVADQVYDRFVDRFVARVKAMNLQPGLAWGSDMGSLISQQQLDAVTAHVEDARSQGRPGARRRPGPARPRARTTTSRPSSRASRPDMACFGDETFGPVVSIYRFSEDEPTRSPAPTTASTASTPRSTPRTVTAAARSPGRSSAARSTSTRRSPRPSPASTPRWAGCASPGSAAARAPRASSATPRRSRSRRSGCSGSARCSGSPTSATPSVMTAQLRLLKKLGRA